jgi:hypothetical protein
MATIIEHFNSVTDEFLKLQLLANLDLKVKDQECDELHDAILNGIESWENTKEGDDYWDEIHKQAYLGEIEQDL